MLEDLYEQSQIVPIKIFEDELRNNKRLLELVNE